MKLAGKNAPATLRPPAPPPFISPSPAVASPTLAQNGGKKRKAPPPPPPPPSSSTLNGDRVVAARRSAPPPPPPPPPSLGPKGTKLRVGAHVSPKRKDGGELLPPSGARPPSASLSFRRGASPAVPAPIASKMGRAKPTAAADADADADADATAAVAAAVSSNAKALGADATKSTAVSGARTEESKSARGQTPQKPNAVALPTPPVTPPPPRLAHKLAHKLANAGDAERSEKKFRARAAARPGREIVAFEEIDDDDDDDKPAIGEKNDGRAGSGDAAERHPSPPPRPLPRTRRKPVRASAGLQAARRRAAEASERVEEARFNRDAQDFLDALGAPTVSESEPAPPGTERTDDAEQDVHQAAAATDNGDGRESPILGASNRVHGDLWRASLSDSAPRETAAIRSAESAETRDGVGTEQNGAPLADGESDDALPSLPAADDGHGAADTRPSNGDNGVGDVTDGGGGGGGGWYPVDDDDGDGRRRAVRARRAGGGSAPQPDGVSGPETFDRRHDGGGGGGGAGGGGDDDPSSYRLDWSAHPVEEGGMDGGGGGGYDETDDDNNINRQYEWATAGLRNGGGGTSFDAERRAHESHETERRKTRELLEFAEQPSANATAPPRAMFDRLPSARENGRLRPARRHESAREEAVRHMCALQRLLLAYFSAVADNDLKVASLNKTLRKIGDLAQRDLVPSPSSSSSSTSATSLSR